MRDAVAAATGKYAAVVVRNLFQPILDVARIQAKTVTKGRLNNDKGNGQGKVKLGCAAVVQFMRTRRWETLITMCLEEGEKNNKRVGGRLWGDVCGEWWDNFATMCVYAWQIGWLSGGDVGKLRECSIRMGKAHLGLQWPNYKLLWSHLWIDHMYFFARKWRTLSEFSCFAMEGSHRRLKCMLRNSGGLSLLRGRLGVQVVVDNHTIDDSLRREGWDVTKRSMCGQGPVTERQLARRARKRALSDLNYVHVISQHFGSRKWRAWDVRTCDHGLWCLWVLELVHATRWRCVCVCETQCENRAIFARIWCIFAFAMAPQTQGKPAVGIGHFVGHCGTVMSPKRAISFRRHPDFIFFNF